jgi:hypothetical protein
MRPSVRAVLLCQLIGFAAIVSAIYFGTVIMKAAYHDHVPFARWGTFAFTSEFQHPHKGIVLFGCYGAIAIGFVSFVVGLRLMRQRLAAK